MVKEGELRVLLTAIEKRRLSVEEKRSLFSIETAFFLPLFAILFLVTLFSDNNSIKMGFFLITLALIVFDVVYSLFMYRDLTKKQKNLERFIDNKLRSH